MKFMTIVMQIGNTGLKGTINNILSEYGVPIVILMLVLGAVVGLIANFEKIQDAKGAGTRKEGLMGVVWTVLAVAIVVVIIGVIIRMTSGLNMSI